MKHAILPLLVLMTLAFSGCSSSNTLANRLRNEKHGSLDEYDKLPESEQRRYHHLIYNIAKNGKISWYRYHAIGHLKGTQFEKDQQRLYEDYATNYSTFFKEDTWDKYRVYAADKLVDRARARQLYKTIIRGTSNEWTRFLAAEKIADQTALGKLVKESKSWATRIKALENLTDLDLIAEIANTIEDEKVRERALNMLPDTHYSKQEYFANVARTNKNWTTRKEAVEKLIDRKILLEIVERDANIAVRKAAAERLNAPDVLVEEPVVADSTSQPAALPKYHVVLDNFNNKTGIGKYAVAFEQPATFDDTRLVRNKVFKYAKELFCSIRSGVIPEHVDVVTWEGAFDTTKGENYYAFTMSLAVVTPFDLAYDNATRSGHIKIRIDGLDILSSMRWAQKNIKGLVKRYNHAITTDANEIPQDGAFLFEKEEISADGYYTFHFRVIE